MVPWWNYRIAFTRRYTADHLTSALSYIQRHRIMPKVVGYSRTTGRHQIKVYLSENGVYCQPPLGRWLLDYLLLQVHEADSLVRKQPSEVDHWELAVLCNGKVCLYQLIPASDYTVSAKDVRIGERRVSNRSIRWMSTNQCDCHHSTVVGGCDAPWVILEHHTLRGFTIQLPGRKKNTQMCDLYIFTWCTTIRSGAGACLHSSWQKSICYRLHIIFVSHDRLQSTTEVDQMNFAKQHAFQATSNSVVNLKSSQTVAQITLKYLLSAIRSKASIMHLLSRGDATAQGIPAVWTASSHSLNPSTGVSSWMKWEISYRW